MIVQAWNWQGKGDPETLLLRDTEIGEPGDHDVLVENTFIGINPVDLKLISNGHPQWQKSHVPGVDGAGVVVKVGKNMKHVILGSRVCYHTNLIENGSFATHTIVKGNSLMAIPENLSDAAAAAFPCPTLTAWQAIHKIPGLQDKKVLVSGAGGSVGSLLVQLLLSKGANVYVSAAVKHHEKFLQMGVIKAFDYRDENYMKNIKREVGEFFFDVIFDTVSPVSAAAMMSLLGYYGHIVSIQGRVEPNPIGAFTTGISNHEIALGAYHRFATDKQIARLMAEGEMLLHRIEEGNLVQKPLIKGKFESLNVFLQQVKDRPESAKYVAQIY